MSLCDKALNFLDISFCIYCLLGNFILLVNYAIDIICSATCALYMNQQFHNLTSDYF